MNFDLGDVLTNAWQISWKNKGLWWLGAILSILVMAILPVAFLPVASPLLLRNRRTDLIPLLLIGFVAFFVIYFIVMYFVSALTQTAITLGILHIKEKRDISLRDLLKNSWPFFWRVVGLMFLYAVVITGINLAIQALIFTLAIGTLGLGMICATPLYLLIYPFMFAAIVWMEQAMNGIIIDGMTIRNAIKQGWWLIRNNAMAITLVTVVVYFGVSMISTVVIMPMLIPFFFAPLSFLEGEPNWTIISLSLLCSVAFLPLFALVSGWAMTFTKSTWVLTYLRLKQTPDTSQAVAQEVPA